MHLYHASVYVSNFGKEQGAYARLNERERELYAQGMQHVLESYHYVKNETFLTRVRADGVKFFLDSGAFSAFTQGVTIDLGAFCDYCHRNADCIRMVSVLDAIGDPDQTWRNQEAMEARGVRPLPCYHYGEPPDVLEYYVRRYDYITIGGMVPVPNNQLEVWLDRVWGEHLTDAEGKPRCRVHGFGLTSPRLMARYPWFSVDSSSWQAMGSNGHVFLPDGSHLTVSANSSRRKERGSHLDNLPAEQREGVAELFRRQGCDVARMREHHAPRWTWNAWLLPYITETRGHRTTFEAQQPELV